MQTPFRSKNFTVFLGSLLCVLVIILISKRSISTSTNIHFISIEENQELHQQPDPKVLKILDSNRKALQNNVGSEVEVVYTETVSLENFQMEKGGNPLRVLIITSWRSGSTFLGDILNSVPGTYYNFEPFLNYGKRKFTAKDSKETKDEVINHLKKLFTCDFSNMESYLNHSRKSPFQFQHNHRLWKACNTTKGLCYTPSFLEPFCKQFPIITSKVVRSNLEVVQDILKDENLNVRILMLVRDPRPTLHSRWSSSFCPEKLYPVCGSPAMLCDQLLRDFRTSEILAAKFPGRFKTIRYEDLALNYYDETANILRFLGLTFREEVKKFLETHTQSNRNDYFGTIRKTSDIPLKWIDELLWEDVSRIQLTEECSEAMKLWGYRVAYSEEELRGEGFNPVM